MPTDKTIPIPEDALEDYLNLREHTYEKTKTKTGVMLMKDGKAWGITYKDSHATQYDWIEPLDPSVDISNPRWCTKPSDLTYTNDPHIDKMNEGKLVKVSKTTTIQLIIEE